MKHKSQNHTEMISIFNYINFILAPLVYENVVKLNIFCHLLWDLLVRGVLVALSHPLPPLQKTKHNINALKEKLISKGDEIIIFESSPAVAKRNLYNYLVILSHLITAMRFKTIKTS